MMYQVLCKVTVCADYTNWENKTEYRFIYAENFREAGGIMDEYYEDDMVACEFYFISEADELLTIPDEFAKVLLQKANFKNV